MAISSQFMFLMHDTASVPASASVTPKGLPSWEKLIDVKSIPKLGGAPELLETTTLSDWMQTFILGIQKLDALEFVANYTLSDYKKLLQVAGKQQNFAVWFGGSESLGVVTPNGKDGKFKFTGALSVFPNENTVNGVAEMTITIAPSTPIALDSAE